MSTPQSRHKRDFASTEVLHFYASRPPALFKPRHVTAFQTIFMQSATVKYLYIYMFLSIFLE